MTALRTHLILRKPQSGCLEGRTAPIQPVYNFFTRSKAGIQSSTDRFMASMGPDLGRDDDRDGVDRT
jgi:hypothetical protein